MIYVVADDLTGAADTGIQFQNHSLQTRVVVDSSAEFPGRDGDVRVLSINVDSRACTTETAYARAYETVKKLSVQPGDLFYKKIDSTLRGNCAAELDAVLDASGRRIALVAPSYPAMERKILNGVLSVPNGYECNVTEIFKQGKRPVHYVKAENLRNRPEETAARMHAEKGSAIFLFDAETDEDLRRVAQLGQTVENPIFCGSAGLATGLLSCCGGMPEIKSAPDQNIRPASLVLTVTGSRKKETAEQIRYLKERCKFGLVMSNPEDILYTSAPEEKIRNLSEELRKELESAGWGVALVFDSLFENQIGFDNETIDERNKGTALAEVLGKVIYQVRDDFDGLVLVGGDTALGVCRGLGVGSILLRGEVSPGVIYGEFADGIKKGMPVVTKSGAFGKPESLADVIRWMRPEQ